MDSGLSLLAAVMSSEPVREAVAEPRIVPREVREYLAEVIARELTLGEDYEAKDPWPVARILGPFYHIYLAAKQTEEWARLKAMSCRSWTIALFCVRAALIALLEAFDEMSGQRLEDDSEEAQIAFGLLIREAMTLWGRSPGHCQMPADQIMAFGHVKDSAKVLNDRAYESFVPRIDEFLEQMDMDAGAMELISLLFPGRLWDLGLAELHRENLGSIRKYASILSRSDEIRQMIDLIGRQSTGVMPGESAVGAYSRSEMHSVVTSGDLHYLLPSELVKLRDPTLKYLFMARWIEGKLLTYQLSGKVRPDPGIERPKGPIVALVDTSGSMSGSPETLAKAVVMTAAKQALKSGRGMRVILFSSRGQSRSIDLCGRRKMAREFLDFLRQGFGGGTDFNTALGVGIEALEDHRYENADLLFISDGLSKITDDSLIEEWGRLRDRQSARIFTVIVGNDTAGGLERISDHVFVLKACSGWPVR